jgi:hypothetical protein
LVQQGNEHPGEYDRQPVSGEHDSGRLAPFRLRKPVGYQHHHGHVGKAAPDARQEIEGENEQEPRAVPDEDHAGGEKDKTERDRDSPSPPGPDVSHLVVAQKQGLSHRGKQHAVGEPGQPQAGEDGQSAGQDNDPAVVDFPRFHGTSVHIPLPGIISNS